MSRPLFEVDVDDGQTKIGDRTNLLDVRQAQHRRLYGIRDERLHLFRRKSLGHGEDLHEIR